ncbi:MAG TPA: ATP synthase F0 subunit B [Bryobacteraceae bacterium]|nr:ATP synthase F0 subunit B [Bryobacteraceae bacterium]
MVQAIPTALFLIFLIFYLKWMLFGPLSNVLKQREALTEGARKSAKASLEEADRKQQEYEARFNQACGEVYKAQEETRRGWLGDQASAVAAARTEAEQRVKVAREQIAADAGAARQDLASKAETLADEIAGAILNGRVGGGA